MQINFLNALAGAGKTRALVRYADKQARHGIKVLFVQPTKSLIDKTIVDELLPLSPDYHFQPLHGDVCVGVVKEIMHYFEKPKTGGQIVFITHAAFILTPFFHGKANWVVLFDEVPGMIGHFDRTLPQTHGIITKYLTTQNAGSTYVQLVAKNPSRLRQIIENKDDDDVLDVFGEVATQVASPCWDVWTRQAAYSKLVGGAEAGKKLITHSILQPTLFEGFKSVTIAAACFEETLLYKLWVSQGVTFTPNYALAKDLRYGSHQNGTLITIHFAVEEDWSKRLRDRVIDSECGKNVALDCVKGEVVKLFAQDPFLWMANKDVVNDFFASCSDAQRLPNSPHGLNEFQDFHKVVVLSALNLTPEQFNFLHDQGLAGDDVHTAISRYAIYQAVMRSSVRNPNDQTPKDFVVMDLSTAQWLASLFPGAKIQRLPGMPSGAIKSKPGRKSTYQSNSARTYAYRARQREELLNQLAAINETSITEVRYASPAKSARILCDETPNRDSQFVTHFSHGDIFPSIYDSMACMSVECSNADEFIDLLRKLHGRVVSAKDESGLISPSRFDPDAATDSKRGLANVEYVNGIWLDNDGGDLGAEEFAGFFPNLRVVVWNTFSHTPHSPRWRAYIPTSKALSLDVHRMIMHRLIKVINENGFWSRDELGKSRRIKNRRVHGFDKSKFNASSLFYLPCQATNPADSFFHDFDDRSRGPLDVVRWLNDCIATLRLEPEPEPVTALASTSPAGDICEQMLRLRRKLAAEQSAKPSHITDQAIAEWRQAPLGQGHAAFFRLARKLHWVGITGSDLEQRLREESAHANSPQDRRGEIRGIVRKLNQCGKIGGRRAA